MSPRSRPQESISVVPVRVQVGVARRSRVRRRWSLVALASLVPGVSIIVFDWMNRSEQLRSMGRHDASIYLLWVLVSACFWGSLVYTSMQRRTKLRWVAVTLLVAGAIFAVGGQAYTFERYRAYLDHRALLVGTSFMPSVGQQLWSDRWSFAHAIVPPLAVALALAFGGQRLSRFRRHNTLFAFDIVVVGLLLSLFGNVGEQGAPPDVLYISALGQLSRAHWDHNETVERLHPGVRSPLPVPALVAHQPVRRNVLWVITESVGAQRTCLTYGPECKWTPFSNEAAKERIVLQQMRALDSTTAISLGIMWTGLLPNASRKELHTAPLLWEYLHAANLESTYWTSQNLLFGNSGTWLGNPPITRRVGATEIEPDATMEIGADDGKLVDYAIGDLNGLKEPYLGIVHLSNTHIPYKVDYDHAPFLPEANAYGPGYEKEVRNRYQDAIYLQDIAVGRLIQGVRARPEGARTVIVFLSDHGDQMHEKGAVGHTGTLWDSEIRVPFWVDAPKGTLTEAEEKSLRSLESSPMTNVDVLPTLLDLMGLWDEPNLAPFRIKMAGESLLRGGSHDQVLPLSNCTDLWACAFKNWGAMKGTHKLIAHQGDRAWGCYDVATDPEEQDDLGVAACGPDLLNLAEGNGRGRPF